MQQRITPLLETLVPLGNWDDLEKALWKITEQVKNLADWQGIRTALEDSKLIDSKAAKLASVYAYTLIGTRDTVTIEDFTKDLLSSDPPMLHLARGWMLNIKQQPIQALSHIDIALEQLSGRLQGMAYVYRAKVLFTLGQVWLPSFENAIQRLKGRERGLCLLELGVCHDLSGKSGLAQTIWLEAASYLQTDTYYTAWLEYNMGITALRDLDFNAEKHFLETKRLGASQYTWLTQAWRGLGAVRRYLGEFDRAEFAYKQALSANLEPKQRIDAVVGLAITLRRSNRSREALKLIYAELVNLEIPPPSLILQLVAAELTLGQLESAITHLAQIPDTLTADDTQRCYLIQAEIALRQDNPTKSLGILKMAQLNSAPAREEFTVWTVLYQLAAQFISMPSPLPQETQRHISVYALGGLRVFVNDRMVTFPPRVGELLVFLLERGGYASREEICTMLYPTTKPKAAFSALRTLLAELKSIFGWENAFTREHGVIHLDSTPTWFYDVTQARQTKRVSGTFLPTIYREWVLEIQAELALFQQSDISHLN